VRLATIAWRSDAGAEWCEVESGDDGFALAGHAIVVERSVPFLITYGVALGSEWQTRRVSLEIHQLDGSELIHLVVEDGAWTLGGEARADLAGCLDVDLSFTPATNTLPIRRLGLGVGDAADIDAAWVRWPELDVVRARQRYERLAEDRYRFTQEDFSAEIAVDSEGLVLEYADIWRAIARG
jgi:hypothetical protein